ncbi:acetylglutamate kinase [Capsulimonas corticalis]|uniref:Acetylglutamate kinase n=1 Tax=Capsulimonas corticalis TaxID=2219043 RepID=A0A402D1L4_9BACT|nr:acetylglutamate kinase [Capsulimonas corticalis]BDI28629.1 acetylglutamate kinase [Capsulimonas corticalis]
MPNQKQPNQAAEVLIQALPYIKQYSGKTIVIKYGGNAMIDETLKAAVMQDIILMRYVGINAILVHGGGPEISDAMQRMGKEPAFVGGLRVTDAETMEIVEMVLTGKTNKNIVAHLNKQGGQAVGLSGKDGNLIVAERETTKGDIGFVGRVVKINPELLHTLSAAGYIPVISSVAIGAEGESYNVNADTVAGELAAALSASKLIVMTDVEGIYQDFADKDSLISQMTVKDARQLITDGVVDKGMIPKIESCVAAIAGGVERAHIIDGRLPHALLIEVFTDQGIGTMIRR